MIHLKKIAKLCIDVANNNSAIGSVMYEVDTDENGKELRRRRITGSERLWADDSSRSNNSYLMPSIILYQRDHENLLADCYGYDALQILQNHEWAAKPCSDIKYRFFVEGKKHGKNAEDFKNLIGHLLSCVRFSPQDVPDAYELAISHPVICEDDDKTFLEEKIGDAWLEWFHKPLKKMYFIDEAECAFRFALTDPQVVQTIQHLMRMKPELHVLLVDIGGSTMELSLHRFMPKGDKVVAERQAMLKADDEVGRGMGSNRVDNQIKTQILSMGVLDVEKVSQIDKNLLNLNYFTPLKETLNNRLIQDKEARLDRLSTIADYQAFESQKIVSKQQFENWCSAYTKEVTRQIEKLCESIHWDATALDLVLLTGGGCALYPVEKAIRQLICPQQPKQAQVLRPVHVSGVIGSFIEGLEGGFPEHEVPSLACVLGNMADKPDITLERDMIETEKGNDKPMSVPAAGKNKSKPSENRNPIVNKLVDLEERKASANKWMWGYVAANFGMGAVIPAGADIPWLMGIETTMAIHMASIMYKGRTDVDVKDLMTSIVGAVGVPLAGTLGGTFAFKAAIQALGVILAPFTGTVSAWVAAVAGGSIAAAMTLALGRTFLYIIEGMITGKIRKSDLLHKDPATMKKLKEVTKENFKQAKKEAKQLYKKKNRK